MTLVLSELITFCTSETDNLDALAREGIPRAVQQILMRELRLLDLCMQVAYSATSLRYRSLPFSRLLGISALPLICMPLTHSCSGVGLRAVRDGAIRAGEPVHSGGHQRWPRRPSLGTPTRDRSEEPTPLWDPHGTPPSMAGARPRGLEARAFRKLQCSAHHALS